ncbi:SDR family oxidoreductase [Streptomyces globosus]|uniref:SDR family oxidoreductase n=1 Tax=Streptomyces globosus TaxID=68209 RepID=UPI0037F707C7
MTPAEHVIGVTPFGEPDARLAAAVTRGGGLGVLDLGCGDRAARAALADLRGWLPGRFGVRVGPYCRLRPGGAAGLLGGPGGPRTVILAAGSAVRPADLPPGVRVLAEATGLAEARAALDAGAHGLVARGSECGGRIGELGTFVLVQQLLDAVGPDGPPVWACGGIAPGTAAAAVAGGAAGVVLDTQLALLAESSLPAAVAAVLRPLDGSETTELGGHRFLHRRGAAAPPPGAPPRDLPDDPERIAALLGGRDPDARLLPVGQDAPLAAVFADRHRDAAGAVRAVVEAVRAATADGAAGRALTAGSPMSRALGTRLPIAQGPMTRVSDGADFARAVSDGGALPFLALALAGRERAAALLAEAAAVLEGRPWGVGILGFAPEETRAAQLEAVRAHRPSHAVIAGGRPSQARALEADGIRTFLHAPSPGLLRQYLAEGARRFVFEGAECGGHVGPRNSFPLWEAQIRVLLDHVAGDPGAAPALEVFFAGGVHDARSAAMVAALSAPLTSRGCAVGVLMGTAYLFTREAVAHGAVQPLFQRQVLAAERTALLRTAPGHATRCVPSPFSEGFRKLAAELRAGGAPEREVWERLERLNVGRLRLASKGVERTAAGGLAPVDEERQHAEGMFMAGQAAVLRHSATTVAELHESVTAGAAAFLERRRAALRAAEPEPACPGPAERAPAPLDIAVVGMACVFPGAPDLSAFWAHVLDGHDAVTEVPAERWDPDVHCSPGPDGSGPASASRWGGFLPRIPFDPLRYGIPPASLGSIEPVQLLALEVSRRALEDAGHGEDGRPFDRARTGVVFGTEAGSDLSNAATLRTVLPSYYGRVPAGLDRQLPRLTEDTFPGVLANVVAGRVANRLDLRGPNHTVDAACASSLAALDAACKELVLGTSDMMLCGGADLHNGINDYALFTSVHALSPTGRSRAFDRSADGIALGEGVACVVLKRLADAERDGDRVYAVVKAVGASSDGRSLGLTAPRPEGQRAALERAYRCAGVSPADVGLVEAHGTGTVVGDRTELGVLTEVFEAAGARAGSCVLGSVKSQIGHTKCAAGLAGLIKTALALHTGVRPPTLHLSRPNSAWRAGASPFVFHREALPWPAAPGRRYAGLSAFGFGGTNFHAVLAGHGADAPPPEHARDEWPAELFLFRGTDTAAARRAAADLLEAAAAAARGETPWRLRDLAATAAGRAARARGGIRIAFTARDVAELCRLLRAAALGDGPGSGPAEGGAGAGKGTGAGTAADTAAEADTGREAGAGARAGGRTGAANAAGAAPRTGAAPRAGGGSTDADRAAADAGSVAAAGAADAAAAPGASADTAAGTPARTAAGAETATAAGTAPRTRAGSPAGADADPRAGAGAGAMAGAGVYWAEADGPGGTGVGRTAFLFPGQGSQRPGMSAHLFTAFPGLGRLLGADADGRAVAALYPPAAFDDAAREETRRALTDTRAAQPALGMVELAAYELLARCGIRPDLAAGHSYGELVALCAAGVVDAEALLRLSSARAAAILGAAGADPGAMAAVSAAPEDIGRVLGGPPLPGGLVVANHNAPRQAVLSGPTRAVEAAVRRLREAGHGVKRLPVACAFHSPLVAAAGPSFGRVLAEEPLHEAEFEVWANRTARPYPVGPDAVRRELAAQIGAPVRFADQIEAMYAAGARTFVEVGPGCVLTRLVSDVLGGRPHRAVACEPRPDSGLAGFLDAVARLAAAGLPVAADWMFRGRDAVDIDRAPAPRTPGWTVDGHLVRTASGDPLPGALAPARPVVEAPVATNPGEAAPGAPDALVAEFLRSSREMIAAQRDVLLAYFGGTVEAAASGAAGPHPLPLPLPLPQPLPENGPGWTAGAGAGSGRVDRGPGRDAAPERAAGAAEAPGAVSPQASAPTGETILRTVLELIAERTGYPLDMVEPDLDLEADLSVDSIKRAEIAGELARRLAPEGAAVPVALDDAELEELARARTAAAIAAWLAARAPSPAPGPEASPATAADAVPAGVRPTGGAPGRTSGTAEEPGAGPGAGHPAGAAPADAAASGPPPGGGGPSHRAAASAAGTHPAAGGPPTGAAPAGDSAGNAPPAAAGGGVPAATGGRASGDAAPEPEVAAPRRYRVVQAEIAGSRPGPPDLAGTRWAVLGDGAGVWRGTAARLAAMLDAQGALRAEPGEGGAGPAAAGGALDGAVVLDALGEAEGPPFLPDGFDVVRAALRAGARRLYVAREAGRGLRAAGVDGLVRSAAREYPDSVVRCVVLDAGAAPGPEGAAEALLEEVAESGGEPVVVRTPAGRFAPVLVEAPLGPLAGRGAGPAGEGAAEAEALGLDRDAVLVVAGGARGITARCVAALAAAARCRVELLGRTPVPAGPEDPLTAAAADRAALRGVLARTGRYGSPADVERAAGLVLAGREVAAALDAVRAAGGRAHYRSVDCRDAAAVLQAVKEIHAEHGRIDGVVHAAGIVEDRLIADKSPESFRRVHGTKTQSAAALLAAVEQLPEGERPRFAVLFGSIAAVLGNRGQSDYAAANDALEAYGAAWAARTGRRALTVHWGPWAPSPVHGGMVVPELARHYARRGVRLIDPEEGAAALLRELAWGDPAERAVVLTASQW